MKMQNDLKWIPSIDLEESCCNNSTNCSKKYCYKSLSDNYLKANKDSRSRSCVFNSVREESYSIIDIINEFAPSHNVEIEENELYPSKARSQRWPLSKKRTKLSPILWYNTQIVIDNMEINDNDDDECMTADNNCNENGFDLDDLWFAAGKTMELPPSPIKDDYDDNDAEQKQYEDTPVKHIEEEAEEEIEEKEKSEEERKTNHTQHVISRIINDLISIPFDEQPLNQNNNNNVQKTMSNSTSRTSITSSCTTSSCTTLGVPRCDMADGSTTRSSSLGSEADIKINYSSSNILYQTEPSISYIIDDANTPIPPNPPPNTSALYEFLFDGVDTDTDDDVFGSSFIEMNQRKSIPFEVINTKKGEKEIVEQPSQLQNNTDTDSKDYSDKLDNNKEEECQSHLNQLHQNKLQQNKPETYVPCRPLWELIK